MCRFSSHFGSVLHAHAPPPSRAPLHTLHSHRAFALGPYLAPCTCWPPRLSCPPRICQLCCVGWSLCCDGVCTPTHDFEHLRCGPRFPPSPLSHLCYFLLILLPVLPNGDFFLIKGSKKKGVAMSMLRFLLCTSFKKNNKTLRRPSKKSKLCDKL